MTKPDDKRKLEISGDNFYLDGKPFRILSGAIHYFRVIPELWEDRLIKLKAMGLNTVETYIAWNFHETKRNTYDFDGPRDVFAFIKKAGELGLNVIVRPGPYICAEWDFGGLPAWLLADENMRVRCLHVPFLDAVEHWFDVLVPKLAELQTTRGGPVIAMQVENEYGSFGTDKKYMQYVEMGLKQRGIDVLLFTSDGWTDANLQGGTLPGVHKTVNFGTKAHDAFIKLRQVQPRGPLMCSEFWNGWYDHWGKPHHTKPAAEAAKVLDEILRCGASVNFYMFHGGTNFGFMNGANDDGNYWPTITSYDYDAPLNECGDPTDKFFAFREVISRHVSIADVPLPRQSKKKAFTGIRMLEQAPLFENLDKLAVPARRTTPEAMEKIGLSHGFALYRTEIIGPRSGEELIVQEVRDRAQVFLGGEFLGTLERGKMPDALPVNFDQPKARLDILVENMGRVNFGPHLLDRKGITQGVRLGNQFLFHWHIYPLALNDLSKLTWKPLKTGTGPAFFRALFPVREPADTFLALPGWTKGVAWINGFNIGRYWERGPQRTLYVPAPLLQPGDNELIIFELHNTDTMAADFRAKPELY